MNSNKFDGESFFLNVDINEDAKNRLNGLDITLNEFSDYLSVFFKNVSNILHQATHEQHRLAFKIEPKILDILIVNDEDTSAFGSRFWNSGHIAYSINHIHSPGLMVHELGHYLYNLGDEYGKCMNDENTPACIMASSFGNYTRYVRIVDGKLAKQEYNVFGELGGFEEFWSDFKKNNNKLVSGVDHFCNEKTHKYDKNSDQYKKHLRESCWEVLIKPIVDDQKNLRENYGLKLSQEKLF